MPPSQPARQDPPQTRQQRLEFVLAGIAHRRAEIVAVLPPDIGFDRFHATINQALRNKPEILDCEHRSILNACIKAAYDGCRIDGREAALVAHRVKVSKNPDRWEDHAEYFPMVFGIVQQILRGGEVIAMEVEVIHANDAYRVLRGTDPRIEHEPFLEGDRGPLVAAYSIATLKTGAKVSCIMTKSEIDDVMREAKTDFVWKRWPGEMAKKSVVRRHRKMLPLGDRDIIDVEAAEMFPQFAAAGAALLPPASAPPRPTRQAIADQAGTESGVPIDEREPDGVLIDAGETAQTEQTREKARPLIDLPESEAAWQGWAAETEKAVLAADTEAGVRAIEAVERDRIAAASDDRRAFIKSLISDRLAEIVSDAAAQQAQGNTAK